MTTSTRPPKPSARRAKGDGSLFWSKKKQVWIGRVVTVDSLGVKRPRQVSDPDRAKCRAMLKAMLESRDAGTLTPRTNETLGQWIESWLANVVQKTRATNTYECYADTYKRYIKPHVGDLALPAVTAPVVQGLLIKLSELGQSYRVLQLTRTVLNGALSLAASPAWHLIPSNPVAGIVAPTTPHRGKPKVWSREHQQAFLDAAQGTENEALYRMALTMGIRQGELLGLQWSDVNLETRVVHVVRKLLQKNGKPAGLEDVKTKSSRRVLRMPPAVVASLRRHRQRLLERGLIACPQVFPTSTGAYHSKSDVYHAFQRFIAKAGLPKISFHGLRHTYVTEMLTRVKVEFVSPAVGHSKTSVTQDIYLGHTDAMVDELDRAATEAWR